MLSRLENEVNARDVKEQLLQEVQDFKCMKGPSTSIPLLHAVPTSLGLKCEVPP